MPPPARTGAGYRQYDVTDLHMLRFIRRARDLGFPISEIAELLGLWQNRKRTSRVVKRLAESHIEALEHKARALLEMKAALEQLVHSCHGDDRPDCPILETLAHGPTRATAAAARLVSPPRTP